MGLSHPVPERISEGESSKQPRKTVQEVANWTEIAQSTQSGPQGLIQKELLGRAGSVVVGSPGSATVFLGGCSQGSTLDRADARRD